MGKSLKTVYAMLVLVALLSTMILSVGESHARYVNTVTWDTFVEPAKEETVSSDWMQSAAQAPTTILLGEMTQEPYQITINLQSKEEISGELQWSTDQAEYLHVTADVSGVITLQKDQPTTLVLTLTPTEKMMTLRQALSAHVTVSWAETMQAMFRIVLPAVPEESGETAQNGEIVENGEVAQDGETVENGEVAQNGETVENGETEANQPEPVERVGVTLDTIAHFAPDSVLPVKLTVGAGAADLRLGLESEDGTGMLPFPSRTRYSLDNGESWYVLYGEGVIDLPPADQVLMQLDLPDAALQPEKELRLAAEAGGEGLLSGKASAAVMPDVDEILHAQQRVLTKDKTVYLALPEQWKEYRLVYAVERIDLQTAENQKEEKIYVAVDDLETGALRGRLMIDEAAYALIFETGETLPTAGTYLVHLKWNYEGVDFGETETSFFVNYLEQAQQEKQQTGGAEQ